MFLSTTGPLLDETDFTKDLVNGTYNMTEVLTVQSTKNIGITTFCTFNNPDYLEKEPTSHLMKEYAELIKNFQAINVTTIGI